MEFLNKMDVNTRFERIVVVGPWGAGKSTLAAQLSEVLKQEVIFLDTVFWKPGWTATSDSEQDTIIADLLKRPRWIIEGDHPRSQDLRFAAADTIIFLDYPWQLCLKRALVRSFKYWGKQRPGGPEGCPEYPRLRVIKWILRYPKRRRPALLKKLELYRKGKTIVKLESPVATEAFLNRLRSKTA